MNSSGTMGLGPGPGGPGRDIVEWQEREYYVGSCWRTLGWAVAFTLLSRAMARCLIRAEWWPRLVKGEVARKKAWRAQNTSVSFLHSLVSGVWALASFVAFPETMRDMIYGNNWLNYNVTCFSLGYFLYDAVDMMRHERSARTYELLFHHFVCVLAFASALAVAKFFPFAGVALLMELNSVFLHLRLLLSLHGLPKTHHHYRLVSLGNIGSFVVFRLLLIGWMLRWVLSRRSVLPTFFFLIGSLGLAAMTVVNLCLFYRLLVADNFWTPAKSPSASSAKSPSSSVGAEAQKKLL